MALSVTPQDLQKLADKLVSAILKLFNKEN